MLDVALSLIEAAAATASPAAFWTAAAQGLSERLGGAGVRIAYRGLRESGIAEAGAPLADGGEAFELTDADGRRVEVRLGAAPGDRAGLATLVDAANRLAVIVGRRAELERERRLGLFVVELSRWLLAAPDTDLLLRYTLESTVALLGGDGGFVALRPPTPHAPELRIVAATGVRAALLGKTLPIERSTTGRVVRSGEPVLSENFLTEPDANPEMAERLPHAGPGIIAPLITSTGTSGALTVVRKSAAPGAPATRFSLADLHYLTAVAAHIAGGFELSQAVAASRAAAHRAEAMVEASPLPLVLVDPPGEVIRMNDAARVIFGARDAADAAGRSVDGLGIATSEGPFTAVLAEHAEGEAWHGRVVVPAPDGGRRVCDCTVTNLAGLGSPHLLVALYDRTEELRAQRELVAREKLATVGELASGVAHEVNNPLAAIRMEAELLSRESADPEVSAATATIVREVDRAARIVRSLLRLSRRSDVGPVRVSLNELVRDVAEIRRRVLRPENVDVRTALHPGAPTVVALGQELQQVVFNLVTNAEYAVRGRRPAIITIGTSAREGWVRLTVDDSGPGVPPAIRGRIFDPFFTTKGPDEGSGLGLSICQRVVAEVGGKLWVEESELGGARFVVDLPAAPEGGAETGATIG